MITFFIAGLYYQNGCNLALKHEKINLFCFMYKNLCGLNIIWQKKHCVLCAFSSYCYYGLESSGSLDCLYSDVKDMSSWNTIPSTILLKEVSLR